MNVFLLEPINEESHPSVLVYQRGDEDETDARRTADLRFNHAQVIEEGQNPDVNITEIYSDIERFTCRQLQENTDYILHEESADVIHITYRNNQYFINWRVAERVKLS